MNHLGVISILVCWFGLLFLVWKWKGDSTMTFSQHAAQKKEAILFYMVLWCIVLPLFVWFMLGPFADKLELGLLFTSLTILTSLGMLGAALIPETNGWKVPAHRFAAFSMAYLLCPVVFVILLQGSISSIASSLLWVIGILMLYGTSRSILERREHGSQTLLFQSVYIALFHSAIMVAYYL